MNDELVHQWNAIGVSKRGLCLVLQTQVIQKFNDKSSESWCLQSIHKLGYHSLIVHLDSNFLVEREIVECSQSDLEEKLIIARNKAVQLFDDSQLLHFSLVFSEDTKFLYEVEDNKQQVRVVSLQHVYQKTNDASIFHFALNLEVLSQVKKQVESYEQHLFLLFDNVCEFLLFFAEFLGCSFVLIHVGVQFECFGFIFEFLDPNYVSLDFMIDNLDGCVTDLV